MRAWSFDCDVEIIQCYGGSRSVLMPDSTYSCTYSGDYPCISSGVVPLKPATVNGIYCAVPCTTTCDDVSFDVDPDVVPSPTPVCTVKALGSTTASYCSLPCDYAGHPDEPCQSPYASPEPRPFLKCRKATTTPLTGVCAN